MASTTLSDTDLQRIAGALNPKAGGGDTVRALPGWAWPAATAAAAAIFFVLQTDAGMSRADSVTAVQIATLQDDMKDLSETADDLEGTLRTFDDTLTRIARQMERIDTRSIDNADEIDRLWDEVNEMKRDRMEAVAGR